MITTIDIVQAELEDAAIRGHHAKILVSDKAISGSPVAMVSSEPDRQGRTATLYLHPEDADRLCHDYEPLYRYSERDPSPHSGPYVLSSLCGCPVFYDPKNAH